MQHRKRRMIIGVMGGADPDTPRETLDQAEETGRRIAEAGAVLLCGGRSGIMEAAARGARSEVSGETLAILPGSDRDGANPYMDLVVATGMGNGRNIINVLSCDAVIAFPGGAGTLSEMALACKCGVPLVSLRAWDLMAAAGGIPPPGYHGAASPVEAVELALSLAKGPVPDGRGEVLSLLEKRSRAWSCGDGEALLACYVQAPSLSFKTDEVTIRGFDALSEYVKRAKGKEMKINGESLTLTPLSGGNLIADYQCRGRGATTWRCTSVLVRREEGFRIINDHWS